MKSVNTAVKDAIRQGHVLYAKPRLIADWNMNRYKSPVADNVPSEDSEGYDIEYFPIESIVEPLRPTKGVAKARIGQSIVSDDYDSDRQARFYVSDDEDVFKYWTSPVASNSSGVLTKTEPFVTYNANVDVNKIVIKLENSWASPDAFTIQLQYSDGGAWTTVSTSPAIQNDGQIILYYNGTAWSTTKPSSMINPPLKSIRGVKMKVTSLKGGYSRSGTPTQYRVKNSGSGYTHYTTDGKNSHFNLIAIEAHREEDLSDRLLDVSDTFDASAESFLYPIGTITSNTAQVSLSNVDGRFNKENTLSPYKDGLLEPNVEFNLEYIYTVGGTTYPVQQFKMYGDEFAGQMEDFVTVELNDYSKYLKETTPRPSMYENLSIPKIIWKLLDSVGFVDYQIDSDDRVVEHTIPIFWVDGSQTVWEVLDEIAKATQSAIYFDGNGILQVKTRDIAFDDAKTPSWTLRGEKSGNDLADIIEWTQTDQFEANHITITYQSTKWSDFNKGQPSMQKVWEPEGTVTLRASELTRTLDKTDTFLWIPSGDAIHWPYEGKVNIQGEIISYEGKHYVYYTGANGNTRNTKTIKSEDERKKFDGKTKPQYRHKNHLTGGLYITERGVWNSENKRHPVEAEGYSVRHIADGTRRTDVAGFHHNKRESQVTLVAHNRIEDQGDLLIATRGSDSDSGFYHYGTQIKFAREKGLKDQKAGIAFHVNGSNEDGYYVELMPSRLLDGKDRGQRHELIFYTRKGGVNKKIGPNNGKGVPLAIAENLWYEIDVHYKASGGDDIIDIWINGRNVLTATVSGSDKNAWGGKFGMFLRGKTKVSYEFLYAIARGEVQPPDDFSFLDLVDGGYRGRQWDREWVFRWRTESRRKKRGSTKNRTRWNQQFFDEFGPIVHEIREFDVVFDPAPVLHSRLYMTNDWSSVCTEYKANPFGAKFILANTNRVNAVVNGEDTVRYGSTDRAVNMVLTALGRTVVIDDAETITIKDDAAIQKRGKIESEINSPWIQHKSMARDIGKWIRKHWSTGSDVVQATIFGNPLIEIGDVIDVSFARKNMSTTTHKYFVVGTSSTFKNGIETVLTLRRVV